MTCYYVYLHRKKTTGEVFYVGKGSGVRAWSEHGRNNLWKRTVKKHDFYVEIVMQNLQEWYSYELEQDLISLYGRISDKTGNLVNMTDGGEGGISGKENCNYDHRLWTFLNVDTQETIVSTKHSFKMNHKHVFIDSMRRGDCSKRWVISEMVSNEKLQAISRRFKGDFNHNSDKDIYTIVNLCTNERLTGTRHFLIEHVPDLNIKNLRSGHTLTSKGWTLLKNIEEYGSQYLLKQNDGNNNGRANTTVYLFYNLLTQETFNGTRHDFKDKYGFSIQDIFTEKNLTVKDWCLFHNIEKAMNSSLKDYRVFSLKNKDGRSFVGTKSQFKEKINENIAALFVLNDPQTYANGWCIV